MAERDGREEEKKNIWSREFKNTARQSISDTEEQFFIVQTLLWDDKL